jgi:hypothetical protein
MRALSLPLLADAEPEAMGVGVCVGVGVDVTCRDERVVWSDRRT